MSGGQTLFLVAGEASGDRLGASLMRGLGRLGADIGFAGVGGPLMEAEGLHPLFPMADLSVMGLAEVLPRLPRIMGRLRETVQAISDSAPAALVTIDSPDFGLRVAARARQRNPDLRTIHYVAPSVWAWRPERAARMARHVDHVLALLPFEPPLMEAEGMSCDFVGHPVVADPQPDPAAIAAFRAGIGMQDGQRILLVLPGSRHGEVARMGPVFGDVLRGLSRRRDDLRVVVVATAVTADRVRELIADWPFRPLLIAPGGRDGETAARRKALAFAAADLALAASGTVALELAAAGTAMVIAYRMNWLTTRIIRKNVRVDSATLINILNKGHDVPEFLFEDCRAGLIVPAVEKLLNDPAARAAQLAASARALAMLGRGAEDPGLRAARSVLGVVGRS